MEKLLLSGIGKPNDILRSLLQKHAIPVNDVDSESSDDSTLTDTDSDTDSDDELVPHQIDYIKVCLDLLGRGVDRSKKRKAPPKPKGGWKKRTKIPYECSAFYRDYHNPNVRQLDHIDAKEFRLDYRMPWTEVHKLVSTFVNRGWVKQSKKLSHHIMGHVVCPPEIKILGILYWLGEGCSFRTIYNLSGRVLSAVSFNQFAKVFCRKVRMEIGPHYIKTPRNVRELRRLSKQYQELGFPGACGSTDGVQIPWEACPFSLRVSATGKEKFPTLGFNVTVDHHCRVIHVCSAFLGRYNDKTKIRYDDYVARLRSGHYSGFSYNVLNQRGEPTACVTPYLICDNGYHRWKQLMAPYKATSNVALAVWSKHLESTRKDVERTFGCIKKRFKILKVPMLYRDVSFIDDIFMTCCVLHNKLLTFDQQFDDVSGMFRYRVSEETPNDLRRTILVNNVRRLLQADDDYSELGRGLGLVDDEVITEVDPGFEHKRKQLAQHLYYLFRTRRLKYTCRQYRNA
jgi:hypothetical protein